MKLFKLLLISACVASMTGCGSSASTKTTPTTTTPTVQKRPLADYDFSESALAEVLDDRLDILASVNLTLEGKSYNKAIFSHELNDELLAVRLQNADEELIDLVISVSEDRDCVIYKPAGSSDTFKCGDANITETDDMAFIQSTLEKSQSNVQLEVEKEFLEELSDAGNTLLTATLNGNNVTITTSYAFDGLLKHVFNIDSKEDSVKSTLGVTTYLQMKEITEQYEGSNMTLNFANKIAGSADDDINMYTGLMIREHNMTTVVAQTGSVESGGTDLFAAGYPRILRRATDIASFEKNKQIGVHSWSNGEHSALEIPYTHESHRKQATYFNKMLGEKGVDFYIFTLEAAPSDGMYFISKADSDKYGLITKIE